MPLEKADTSTMTSPVIVKSGRCWHARGDWGSVTIQAATPRPPSAPDAPAFSLSRRAVIDQLQVEALLIHAAQELVTTAFICPDLITLELEASGPI